MNYDNVRGVRFEEVARTRRDMHSVEQVAGGRYLAKLALARDYDNEWDGEHDQWHGPLAEQSVMGIFTAMQRVHVPLDVVNLCSDKAKLVAYELIFCPHLTIVDETMVRRLEDYVLHGGVLVLGARSGYKDRQGHCEMKPMSRAFATAVRRSCGGFQLPAEYTAAQGSPTMVTVGDSAL